MDGCTQKMSYAMFKSHTPQFFRNLATGAVAAITAVHIAGYVSTDGTSAPNLNYPGPSDCKLVADAQRRGFEGTEYNICQIGSTLVIGRDAVTSSSDVLAPHPASEAMIPQLDQLDGNTKIPHKLLPKVHAYPLWQVAFVPLNKGCF